MTAALGKQVLRWLRTATLKINDNWPACVRIGQAPCEVTCAGNDIALAWSIAPQRKQWRSTAGGWRP